jgi:hypothetical protein
MNTDSTHHTIVETSDNNGVLIGVVVLLVLLTLLGLAFLGGVLPWGEKSSTTIKEDRTIEVPAVPGTDSDRSNSGTGTSE